MRPLTFVEQLQNEIVELKKQQAFLVETFTERDATQRLLIQQYEAATVQLKLQNMWYKAQVAPGQVEQ